LTNQELINIDEQIKDLKEKKRVKIEEIKKQKKEYQKKRKRDNNSPNVLKRISSKFNDKIDFINEKREELGFNLLSKPKITELIIRHNLFSKIEEDLIHFDINLEENGGIKNA
jgi:hypothetical protein